MLTREAIPTGFVVGEDGAKWQTFKPGEIRNSDGAIATTLEIDAAVKACSEGVTELAVNEQSSGKE